MKLVIYEVSLSISVYFNIVQTSNYYWFIRIVRVFDIVLLRFCFVRLGNTKQHLITPSFRGMGREYKNKFLKCYQQLCANNHT